MGDTTESGLDLLQSHVKLDDFPPAAARISGQVADPLEAKRHIANFAQLGNALKVQSSKIRQDGEPSGEHNRSLSHARPKWNCMVLPL